MFEPSINTSHRDLRAFRFSVVSRLAVWLEEDPFLSVEPADWNVLDELPRWCVLDNQDIRRLTEVIGAFYYLDSIKRIIDGEQLRKIYELIGTDLVSDLHKKPRLDTNNPVLDTGLDIPLQFLEAGLAILESTIRDERMRNAFLARIEIFGLLRNQPLRPELSADSACELYQTVFNLLVQCMDGGGVIGTGDNPDVSAISA